MVGDNDLQARKLEEESLEDKLDSEEMINSIDNNTQVNNTSSSNYTTEDLLQLYNKIDKTLGEKIDRKKNERDNTRILQKTTSYDLNNSDSITVDTDLNKGRVNITYNTLNSSDLAKDLDEAVKQYVPNVNHNFENEKNIIPGFLGELEKKITSEYEIKNVSTGTSEDDWKQITYTIETEERRREVTIDLHKEKDIAVAKHDEPDSIQKLGKHIEEGLIAENLEAKQLTKYNNKNL